MVQSNEDDLKNSKSEKTGLEVRGLDRGCSCRSCSSSYPFSLVYREVIGLIIESKWSTILQTSFFRVLESLVYENLSYKCHKLTYILYLRFVSLFSVDVILIGLVVSHSFV